MRRRASLSWNCEGGDFQRDNIRGEGFNKDKRQYARARERDEGWETKIRIRIEGGETDRGRRRGAVTKLYSSKYDVFRVSV